MQRVELQESELSPNFIGSWMMEPMSVSDRLIDYFESNYLKQKEGVTSGGRDTNSKKRTDISVSPNEINLPGNEIFNEYFHNLFGCYKDYLVQWPFLIDMGANLEIGPFNIGKYNSGEHFQKLHTERASLNTLHRVLAWMTYLNDVDEGGSTSFTHYGIEIQPRKGLTLMWPAEWTHAHKGNTVKMGPKYIITGWMYFPE